MTTVVASNPWPRFNMRACPIWAIPQLAELRRRLGHMNGAMISSFRVDIETQGTPDACGTVSIWVKGEGFYRGILYKSDMNKFVMPRLYPC